MEESLASFHTYAFAEIFHQITFWIACRGLSSDYSNFRVFAELCGAVANLFGSWVGHCSGYMIFMFFQFFLVGPPATQLGEGVWAWLSYCTPPGKVSKHLSPQYCEHFESAGKSSDGRWVWRFRTGDKVVTCRLHRLLVRQENVPQQDL